MIYTNYYRDGKLATCSHQTECSFHTCLVSNLIIYKEEEPQRCLMVEISSIWACVIILSLSLSLSVLTIRWIV